MGMAVSGTDFFGIKRWKIDSLGFFFFCCQWSCCGSFTHSIYVHVSSFIRFSCRTALTDEMWRDAQVCSEFDFCFVFFLLGLALLVAIKPQCDTPEPNTE